MSDTKAPPKRTPAGRTERDCPEKAKAIDEILARLGLDTRITIPASLVDTGIAYVKKQGKRRD